MKYHVVFADSFTEDLDEQIDYLLGEQVSVVTIENWFTELYKQIACLDKFPKRFSVDPVQTRDAGKETRKINIEDYLVFYQVDDEQKQVHVVAFMHGSLRKESNHD